MIGSLLIANRGEIACRIIRTARAMGIRTIAVHSDADAGALHVREADEAIAIGPAQAIASYLNAERILAAAAEARAEAIHPGYGFLSENADFAEQVMRAGLVWVGAPPTSIRAMGLKDAAKALMQQAGVPVTPGYLGQDQSETRLQAEAEAIGFPVLIKAVAGGGGKGMRKVEQAEDFATALQSCKREARSSFGNDAVILEKWIENPRHIEVQVFGDAHGNAVHLFERDCSLQRRHQKVIEEAPAPGMDAATREAICAAAVRAAQAVDYVGAGTVEFIADATQGLSADRIFFMEMNTRLQVEHPVTETITGIDLVEWQLRVACGEELPLRQEDIAMHGHAVEARLYAEDPARGFLPSIGTLEVADFPYDLRVETGVERGDAISPFYDPMIAKLVAHGESRGAALDALADGLRATHIWPVRTNAAFLLRCLADQTFRAGEMTTGLIEARGAALTEPPAPSDANWKVAAIQLFAPYFIHAEETPRDPWAANLGFRLNAPDKHAIAVRQGETVRILNPFDFAGAKGLVVPVDGGVAAWNEGQPFLFSQARCDADTGLAANAGDLVAPMPGRVIAVDVAEGDAVRQGQRLLVLEAMKMEHALTAPFDGVVTKLATREGSQVQVEALLARVEKAAD